MRIVSLALMVLLFVERTFERPWKIASMGALALAPDI